MPSWSELTDDQLFDGSGEGPANQDFYDRRLEIQRREYELEKRTSEAQIAAADAQVRAARWTMVSAIAIAITVVVTGLGIWLD